MDAQLFTTVPCSYISLQSFWHCLQAFLLAAMKMHCFLRALSQRDIGNSVASTRLINTRKAGVIAAADQAGGTGRRSRISIRKQTTNRKRSNSLVVMRTIHAVITYTCRLVRNRLASAATRHNLPLKCDVPMRHVRWLGYTAFYNVLNRKQSSYNAVLQVR